MISAGEDARLVRRDEFVANPAPGDGAGERRDDCIVKVNERNQRGEDGPGPAVRPAPPSDAS